MEGGSIGGDLWLSGTEKLFGRDMCCYTAFFEQDDPMGEIESFVEIVGDEEDRFMQAGEQIAEHVLHFGASEGIEGAERLVHEEDGRVGGEGARKPDALALASGELVWRTRAEGVGIESDGSEQFARACFAIAAGAAFSFRHNADVALDGEVWKEAGFLDDIAHAATQANDVAVARVGPADQNLSGDGLHHAVDGAQESGFSGSAAAKESGGSTGLDCK